MKKKSHSYNFLPLTAIHYLAHSIEGLIIESGHPVEGTTILPGMQQEIQESSLEAHFCSFCLHSILHYAGLHSILHYAGQFYSKFLLILLRVAFYVNRNLVQVTAFVVHIPTVAPSMPIFSSPSMCSTY